MLQQAVLNIVISRICQVFNREFSWNSGRKNQPGIDLILDKVVGYKTQYIARFLDDEINDIVSHPVTEVFAALTFNSRRNVLPGSSE